MSERWYLNTICRRAVYLCPADVVFQRFVCSFATDPERTDYTLPRCAGGEAVLVQPDSSNLSGGLCRIGGQYQLQGYAAVQVLDEAASGWVTCDGLSMGKTEIEAYPLCNSLFNQGETWRR